jgi:hypothetical protein
VGNRSNLNFREFRFAKLRRTEAIEKAAPGFIKSIIIMIKARLDNRYQLRQINSYS